MTIQSYLDHLAPTKRDSANLNEPFISEIGTAFTFGVYAGSDSEKLTFPAYISLKGTTDHIYRKSDVRIA